MKNVSRRNFIAKTSLGSLSFLFPISILKANSRSTFKTVTFGNDAKTLAQQAKVHFFKKEYALAENLLQQAINAAPNDIRYYDNLRRVFGAQGKLIEVVQLLKTGLNINKTNIAFYDRYAIALMQLELGNKKLFKQYTNNNASIDLLKKAKKNYKKAIKIDDKKYLKIGLKKVNKKIKQRDLKLDFRTNLEYKFKKKKRKNKHRKRYNKLTIQELKQLLVKLDTKKRREFYTQKEIKEFNTTRVKEKRQIYTVLLRKLKKEKQFEDAKLYGKEWFTLDPTDSMAVKKTTRLFLKTKDFSGLVDFKRYQADKLPTFWSALALVKAYFKAYKKKQVGSLNEAKFILDDLVDNWNLTSNLKVLALGLKGKLFLIEKDFNAANNVFLSILENYELKSPALIIETTQGFVRTLMKGNIEQKEEAKFILKSMIYKDFNESSSLPPYFNSYFDKIKKTSSKNKLPLLYLLHKTYKKLGEDDYASKVLVQIKSFDNDNKYVIKHQ